MTAKFVMTTTIAHAAELARLEEARRHASLRRRPAFAASPEDVSPTPAKRRWRVTKPTTKEVTQ
jgi:hypothetical protein